MAADFYAGVHVLYGVKDYRFESTIAQTGGGFAFFGFFLFAVASVASMRFCSFIAGNGLATMITGVSPSTSTMVGPVVAALLAISGAACNLLGLFTIIGTSFAPIYRAMVADYWLSGKKWAGPREGVNIAGYEGFKIGLFVGILPFLPISPEAEGCLQAAAVYSFFVSFMVYAALVKAGLEAKVVSLPLTGGEQLGTLA